VRRSSTSWKARWSTRSTASPPKVYSAGEALTVPAGVIHAVRNVGTGTALATDIVEKGKPLLTVAQ
jgi:quercetin dioxygenase-like cupin family protein